MCPHVDTDLKLHKENVHQIQYFVLIYVLIYYIYPLTVNVRMRENRELHTL